MVEMNPHFSRIQREVIFPIIEQKIAEMGDVSLINLGIGDVALPLDPHIAEAFSMAVQEMTMRPIGYGPAAGYVFLREKLLYADLSIDEIFISDGINTDLANIGDILSPDAIVATIDPGYPVFGDTHLMAGRTVITLPCTLENGFIPQPPQENIDVVYLCSPGNPTGVAMTYKDLEMWVSYALEHDVLIIFDAAYADFITSDDVPKSIYEIPDAKKVAIEMRSFSKGYGFTGLRCSSTAIPKETGLNTLWHKRQNTKYNGCAYPIQKAAAAALDITPQINVYLDCAKQLKSALGNDVYGGVNSPYLWWKVPEKMTSWEFFDQLLFEHRIVGIPGSGFGKSGEGYLRLSAFTTPEVVSKAIKHLGQYAY